MIFDLECFRESLIIMRITLTALSYELLILIGIICVYI